MIVFFNKTGNPRNYILSSSFFSVIQRVKKNTPRETLHIIDPYLGMDIKIRTENEFMHYYQDIARFSEKIELPTPLEEIRYVIVYIEWWNESLAESLLFCKYIQSIHKNAQIIYYGPFANGYADDLMGLYPEIIDYVVKNEAEEIIEDIVLGKIAQKSIIDGNEYRRTENFLDFHDYSLILEKNPLITNRPVEFEFSRGCIIDRCFFCMCTLGKKLRLKPIEIHLSDMRKLLESRFSYLYFVDAEINSVKAYMYQFLGEYSNIQKKYPFFWSGYLIPKNITQEDCEKMYSAGCRHLRIGFESATQSRLDTIAKRTNLSEMKDIIKYCKNAGITVQLHCIVGYPEEESIEIQNILTFIKENHASIDIMNFYEFKPRRTTYVYDHPGEFHLEIQENPITRNSLPFIKDDMPFIVSETGNLGGNKENKLVRTKILLLEQYCKQFNITTTDPKEYFIQFTKEHQCDK